MNGSESKKIAYLGLYCAAAVILGYVEMLIPVFAAVPGMKLGLPNLALVTAMYMYSWKEAAFVSVVRICVIGLLFGNLFSVCFSLAGGLLSLLCMALVKKTGLLDITGVSMIGGVTHNAGQITAAALLVENVRVAYYFIPLAITGLVTGVVIGILSGIMVKRITDIVKK